MGMPANAQDKWQGILFAPSAESTVPTYWLHCGASFGINFLHLFRRSPDREGRRTPKAKSEQEK